MFCGLYVYDALHFAVATALVTVAPALVAIVRATGLTDSSPAFFSSDISTDSFAFLRFFRRPINGRDMQMEFDASETMTYRQPPHF